MEKEFIPMDLALRLKALGFDEACLAYWDDNKVFELNTEFLKGSEIDDTWLTAPTWNSAFDWFRENHPYRFYVLPCSQHEKYLFEITLPSSIFYTSAEDEAYNTYKEARQALLIKLIEIVK